MLSRNVIPKRLCPFWICIKPFIKLAKMLDVNLVINNIIQHKIILKNNNSVRLLNAIFSKY